MSTLIKVVEFNKPYQLTTIPTPSPDTLGPYDLLVKIAVASYCHTDSMIRAGTFATPLPIVASHEGAGTVVAAGSEALAAGWRAGPVSVSEEAEERGDRVMCGLPYRPCGRCRDCTDPVHESWRQYCVHTQGGHCGVHRDGFLAEYALCDARTSTRLPRHGEGKVSLLSAAPLACAGRTVWRAIELARASLFLPPLPRYPEQGQAQGQKWLAIVGSGGGLGHLGVQFAKKRGFKVIGIDARDQGLAITREMGADLVLDARAPQADVVRRVQEATKGQEGDVDDANTNANANAGADATVTLSDHPSAAALACAVTKMHGTMVQVAQPDHVVLPFQELVFRDIRVQGSVVSSPEESNAMVRFLAEHGGVQVKTNVFQGLDKMDELLDVVHGGEIQGKAVIVVDPEQIEQEKKLGAKYW